MVLRKSQRREFLKLGFLASASAMLGNRPVSAKPKQTQILVIGAGISGIAAARQLKAQGFQVTLLEGRDRVGGRIYTNRTLGIPVDLGASWIHGITNNPIGKLAREFQIRTQRTDYDNLAIYGVEGQPLDEEIIEQTASLAEGFLEQAKATAEDLDRDISVAAALQSILNRIRIPATQIRLIQWHWNSSIVLDTGTDLDNLSMQQWDEDEEFGGDDFVFPNGYDQLIQALSRGLDIKLNQKVEEIVYEERGVSVKTNRGAFTADVAVITLPLGVLKSGTVKFSPTLPQRKLTAINRLQMGVLNKVALKFPKIFWPEDLDLLGYVSQNQKDFAEFLNVAKYSKSPVLMALVGGSFAQGLEGRSDSEISAGIMKLLRQVHGNSIPNPERIIRTKWASDPFSLGSYSAMPVGSRMSDRTALGAAIGKQLYWAGEATSRTYPGTVHGAFLSGLQVAEKMIQELS